MEKALGWSPTHSTLDEDLRLSGTTPLPPSLEYWCVIPEMETVSPSILSSFGEDLPIFTVDLEYECCIPEVGF